MTCSTCGTEIQPGEKTCSLCGAEVSPAAVSAPPAAAPSATALPTAASPSAAPAVPGAARSDSTVSMPAAAIQPAGAETTPARTPRSPFVDDEIQSLLRQGYIHLRRKNLAAAREACSGVFALDQDDPQGHELLGLILEEEGDEMAALREYRLACAEEPKPVEAETHMARILLSLPPDMIARLQPERPRASEELPPEVEARINPEFRAQLAANRPAPPRKTRATFPAFASLAIPGCGQLIKGQYGKAIVMFLVWLGCAVMLSTFMPQRWSNHQNVPLTDPVLWGVAFVMLVDYVISIGDAASPPDPYGS